MHGGELRNDRYKNGCSSYGFSNGDVPRLKKKSAQVSKRACGSQEGSTTLTLSAVSVFFRADCRQVGISKVSLDYDKHRGLNVNPEPASGTSLYALVDQDRLWVQAGDAVELSAERLNASRELLKVPSVSIGRRY